MKMACAKIKVDGRAWEVQKAQAIPQQGSSSINVPGQPARNLLTTEKLGDSGKINMNIKGPDNLAGFNRIVEKVSKIDPNSLKYKNTCTKNLCRMGKPASTAAAGAAASGACAGEAKRQRRD